MHATHITRLRRSGTSDRASTTGVKERGRRLTL